MCFVSVKLYKKQCFKIMITLTVDVCLIKFELIGLMLLDTWCSQGCTTFFYTLCDQIWTDYFDIYCSHFWTYIVTLDVITFELTFFETWCNQVWNYTWCIIKFELTFYDTWHLLWHLLSLTVDVKSSLDLILCTWYKFVKLLLWLLM